MSWTSERSTGPSRSKDSDAMEAGGVRAEADFGVTFAGLFARLATPADRGKQATPVAAP
jgi:hypothetical protein